MADLVASTATAEDSGSDDEDGLFMADFFTKDLDIEDDFQYTYGEEGDGQGGGAVVRLRGIAREFGQTTLGKGDGTGLTIWRGAEELCRYLWARRSQVAGKRCLELGAGLGLVGLVVAHLGPACNVVTDGDEATCDRICENAGRNALVGPPAPGEGLDWAVTARHFCRSNPDDAGSAVSSSSSLSFSSSSSRAPLASATHPLTVMTVARLLWCDPGDMAKAKQLAAPPNATGAPLPPPPAAEPSLAAPAPAPEAASATAATVALEATEATSSGGDGGRFDLILAADVVYDIVAVVPLVATVAAV